MNLNAILGAVERRKNPKRRGRGEGSGLGKSAGRGNKGAKSRAGWRTRYEYEGGQMPIVRRVPKRGFSNFNFAGYYDVINVGELGELFEAGATVDLKTLTERGIVKPRHGRLKVLGDGALSKKITVIAHRASEEARKKIEAAGGTLTCLVITKPRKPRPDWQREGLAQPSAKGKGAKEAEAAAGDAGAEGKAKKEGKPKEGKQEKGGGGKPAAEAAAKGAKGAKGPEGKPSEGKGGEKKAGKKGEEKS